MRRKLRVFIELEKLKNVQNVDVDDFYNLQNEVNDLAEKLSNQSK